MSTPTPDVVVVGAGVVGACTAYELTRAGLRVHVVDQEPWVACGASHANAGLLAPSHAEPLTGAANIRTGLRHMLRPDSSFHVRPSPRLLPWLVRFGAASGPARVAAATRVLRDLGTRSLARHASYREQGVQTSFERRGLVDVFRSEAARDGALASLARTPVDLEHEVLDAAGVQEVVPGLAGAVGGIRFGSEGHCDGRVLTGALLTAAEGLGAHLTLGSRVRELLRSGEHVTGVRTDDGDIAAGHVVLAGGYRSSALLRPLGARLPLAPAKGYVIDLQAGPEDPVLPVGLKEDLVVLTPYPDRVRLAGTLELVGEDRRISTARTGAIREAGLRALPALADRDVLATRVGLRPCSPDGLPIVGPVPSADGLTVATGHGQQGVLLAPVTGQIVAGLLTGPRSSPPPELDPARFRGSAVR